MKRWLMCLLLVACASHKEEDASLRSAVPDPPKDAIAKTAEAGPVKATVQIWPAKPTLGDPIYARLTVEAPAGLTIAPPAWQTGDHVGRFQVAGFTQDQRHGGDGGQILEQTYTLDAPASGRQRMPALRIEITGEKKQDELLTDEIPLEIAPVAAATASAPLHDAAGTLDPDVGGTDPMTIVLIISIAAVGGAGGILGYRMLGARRRTAARKSAYEEAVAQLRELETRGAPDEGDADRWFVALSAIVRRYLEHRYEIRAPEQTTEEFLLIATARPELTGEHRALLVSFLERCDRVKFAGYRPDADESLATLSAARGFVEDTRPRDELGKAAA
ncbi:MAG TPA: hypothetical protein VGM88_06115 [Kofleriaceae bacterium]|jgi:hypothetical protein